MAMTQLKREQSKKLGIQGKGKRKRAGWDTDYLEVVLKMQIQLRLPWFVFAFALVPRHHEQYWYVLHAQKLS